MKTEEILSYKTPIQADNMRETFPMIGLRSFVWRGAFGGALGMLALICYAGSTLKCNCVLIEKDLFRVLEPERFAWPIVKPIHNEVQVAIGDVFEVRTLRTVLTNQPVGVFV